MRSVCLCASACPVCVPAPPGVFLPVQFEIQNEPVRQPPAPSLFQAAMVQYSTGTVLYQASERVRRSGPVVVPPRTWIPPRSYYQRRSKVY